MNIKKRGLGRGLEALLVNVSDKEEASTIDIMQPSNEQLEHETPITSASFDPLQQESTSFAKMHYPDALALIESLQKEKLNLLQEVESLKQLINDFDTMIREF
jgi:ParB family chromosome partitioning protein